MTHLIAIILAAFAGFFAGSKLGDLLNIRDPLVDGALALACAGAAGLTVSYIL